MLTNVIVETTEDAVEVTFLDINEAGEWVETEGGTLGPNATREFMIDATRKIHIQQVVPIARPKLSVVPKSPE